MHGLAWNRIVAFARALIVAGFLFALLPRGHAFSMSPPGTGGGTNSVPTYTLLNSWSFYDNTNWTNDKGYAPVSFTNLDSSYLGNFSSLVVDSSDSAWLQFNVQENDGTTNLAVDSGTVMFWFAPGSWSGTNQGGTGPGMYGRLLEAGSYTPDSSFGWWSIYVDDVGANLYFSTQTNDLSSNVWTYLSVPIAWTTNYFHFVVLTYSATNTALYLDGGLATNGPALAVYPGANALTNGFFIGSDSTGMAQAHGLFNSLATYNTPLDAGTIQHIFNQQFGNYMMNPFNVAMSQIVSAPSSPSTGPTVDVITGQGNLTDTGISSIQISSTNVWLTNVMAVAASDGTMTLKFTIEGGTSGAFYDVFATGDLARPITSAIWTWQGQGQQWRNYSLATLTNTMVYLILGTPLDSDTNGLTDAYELLVTHTNPYSDDQDGAGIPNGWQVLLGLNPLVNQVAQPTTRANYNYTAADWLNQVSNARSGGITNDAEGNVLKVSQ